MSANIDKLNAIPLFKELPTAVTQTLLKDIKVAAFNAGQTIGNAGEQLNYLLAISSGIVHSNQLNAERKVIISSSHGPGSLIGWLAAIDNKPLAAALIAKTAAEILLIPMATARKVLLNCQPIVSYLLTQMAALIRKHEDERRMLALPNAYQRIYVHILNLAQENPGGLKQARLPKQDEIAVHVNTSRETVSRAVQQLLKQGIITKQGHRIHVERPELLKQLAEAGVEATERKALERTRAAV